MATTKKRLVATPEFCLDIAFSSAVSPVDKNSPIAALGHGWAENADGQWKKSGNVVQAGDTVGINVYDGSPSSGTTDPPVVSSITVTPINGNTFFPTGPVAPTDLGPGVKSAGTNMVGRAWFYGSFSVPSSSSGTTYDFTVTILMSDGKQFRIDPRMIVGTSNIP